MYKTRRSGKKRKEAVSKAVLGTKKNVLSLIQQKPAVKHMICIRMTMVDNPGMHLTRWSRRLTKNKKFSLRVADKYMYSVMN